MKRFALALLAPLLLAAAFESPPVWTEPTAAFQITDNVYYVGTKGLAAYLIRSDSGLILLDGTMTENVPAIERSIAGLGFKVTDIKILIASHAHFDHVAGLAALKAASGARLIASREDRQALETGTPPSDTNYGVVTFPAVGVDSLLTEGRAVRLGNVAITPTVTPGHTPGCTTWSMPSRANGRAVRVIFPCSVSVAGNKLVGNKGYPAIARDFPVAFRKLRAMKADIVLPAHPDLVDLIERAERRRGGDADAFMMPGLLPKLVDDFEAAFKDALAEESL